MMAPAAYRKPSMFPKYIRIFGEPCSFMWTQFTEVCGKTVSVVIILILGFLTLNLYWSSQKSSSSLDDYGTSELFDIRDKIVDGYLVYNSKCHMLDKSPLDPSIKKFFKKYKYESCSNGPLLSFIEKESNGTLALVINQNVSKTYENLFCCWTPITRPTPGNPPSTDCDTRIDIGHCEDFKDRVTLPADLEVVMITCRQNNKKAGKKPVEVYKNIHAFFNPAKVQKRWNISERDKSNNSKERKLSILLLGIDSISRSNLRRNLPKTVNYLHENGWHDLRGYNKMGDNTFPNFMAFLTGLDSDTAFQKCDPKKTFGLDKCPFIWHNFRNAGYTTAYGEDDAILNTFNHLKVGFVDPPTDYYLRPYIVACEKLMKIKKRFKQKYCTGPELTVDRIFNSAFDFAKTFSGSPYFGFFWTNTVSHDDLNEPSSMDDHFLEMFQDFEKEGITNDTMIVFFSDHGTRWGEFREKFVGWYEERLPFIYVSIPNWIKDKAEISETFRINKHRLTSPFDLYETLRDILIKSGGNADRSSGCPTCQSLLKPVPFERGCEDAGILPHWCTCTAFEPGNANDKIAQEGAQEFLRYIDNAVKDYKDKNGQRLCAKLKLKRILRVDKIVGFDDGASVKGFFYLMEMTPGGAKFEATIKVHGNGSYSVSSGEISRINSYLISARCLENGPKPFCHCSK